MLDFLDVVTASALGMCLYSTATWLGGCIVAATKSKPRGEPPKKICSQCGKYATPLSALGRCWNCFGADVGYFNKSSSTIYDIAGNAIDLDAASKLPASDARLEPSLFEDFAVDPTPRRRHVAVPEPIEVEVVANRLTDVGFVALSLRPVGSWAEDERALDDMVGIVEAAAERLRSELRPCKACRRLGGLHDVDCVEVKDMLDMAAPEMRCRDEIEAAPTETSKEATQRRHIEAEDK